VRSGGAARAKSALNGVAGSLGRFVVGSATKAAIIKITAPIGGFFSSKEKRNFCEVWLLGEKKRNNRHLQFSSARRRFSTRPKNRTGVQARNVRENQDPAAGGPLEKKSPLRAKGHRNREDHC